jgi:hypothetical protein
MNNDKISPILVFISSSQDEFEKLRKFLKTAIEKEFRLTTRAVLIEEEQGVVISKNIREKIEKSSIYVGIFGKKYSEWTVAEYCEARRMGLPLLIYHLKKGPSGRRAGGRKSAVEKFLENEARRFDIRVRIFSKEEEIPANVINDVAFEIAELVKEAISHRGIIFKSLPPP